MSEITRFQILNDKWVRYDDHLAEVERLNADRDATQRERERLQDLLKVERQELSTLRDRLRVLQTDPSASLTSSRPTDEDIWREAFMAAMERGGVFDRMTVADLALAEYRKRWPR